MLRVKCAMLYMAEKNSHFCLLRSGKAIFIVGDF